MVAQADLFSFLFLFILISEPKIKQFYFWQVDHLISGHCTDLIQTTPCVCSQNKLHNHNSLFKVEKGSW